MARPQKERLDYFPLVCGFFKNRKIKRLRRAFGEIGILTYINLLCKIYDVGYYLKFDNIDDLSNDIIEEITDNQLTKKANCVTRCIHYMADNGLLDKSCLEIGVITSRAIQEQYITSMEKSKRKGKIKEYALIDSTFTISKNEDSSEETTVNTEETSTNSELMQQTKSNQSKQKQTNILDSQTADEIVFYVENINFRLERLGEEYPDYKQRLTDILNSAIKYPSFQINKTVVSLVEFLKAFVAVFSDPTQILNMYDTIDGKESIKNKFLYTIAAIYNTGMKF